MLLTSSFEKSSCKSFTQQETICFNFSLLFDLSMLNNFYFLKPPLPFGKVVHHLFFGGHTPM
jgi:hypothetical protein